MALIPGMNFTWLFGENCVMCGDPADAVLLPNPNHHTFVHFFYCFRHLQDVSRDVHSEPYSRYRWL